MLSTKFSQMEDHTKPFGSSERSVGSSGGFTASKLPSTFAMANVTTPSPTILKKTSKEMPSEKQLGFPPRACKSHNLHGRNVSGMGVSFRL